MGFLLVILNKKLRKKMYYTTHSNIFSRNRDEWIGIVKFNLKLNFFMMNRIKKSVALNDKIRDTCIKYGKVHPEKIEVIPNGVNVQLFNTHSNLDDIKQKYGLNEQILILYVGRIHKIKGIEYLIKSANKIINLDEYNVLFLLVGPIENTGIDKLVYDDMVDLIRSFNLQNNVRFTGAIPIDDLQKLYAACDIFVLPSFAETFGLVITEAMASGKPVVTTKTDGALIQIKDKWNGFLVESADEVDLAEKIKILIDNEDYRKQFGLNGRKLAESEFDWNKISKKHLQMYFSD
jgi:glycosyltransferase involved in cell wall biosynthesis